MVQSQKAPSAIRGSRYLFANFATVKNPVQMQKFRVPRLLKGQAHFHQDIDPELLSYRS